MEFQTKFIYKKGKNFASIMTKIKLRPFRRGGYKYIYIQKRNTQNITNISHLKIRITYKERGKGVGTGGWGVVERIST